MTQSRENFVRLAEARTRKTLKDIRLIGNLSNRSNYNFSEEDIRLSSGKLKAAEKLKREKSVI